MQWEAKLVLQSGQLLEQPSPCGVNGSFAFDFLGPYLNCAKSLYNSSLPGSLSEPQYPMDYYEGDWDTSLARVFWMNTTRPLGEYVAPDKNVSTAWINNDAPDVRLSNMLATEVNALSCTPAQVQYSGNTTYINGNEL